MPSSSDAEFEAYLRASVERHLSCNLNDNARFLAEQLVAAIPNEVRRGLSAPSAVPPFADAADAADANDANDPRSLTQN